MIDVAWMTRGGQIFRGPAEMFKRWHELPYGMWTCADGRQVLFNRFYEPILQRPRAARPKWPTPKSGSSSVVKNGSMATNIQKTKCMPSPRLPS